MQEDIPVILGGDINVKFASDEALPPIQFRQDEFSLTMNKSPSE